MQSDSKEIYRLTAVRTGKSESIYKDIGNFIQQETAFNLKKPKSLIIKLRGLGFWYLRRGRIIKTLEHLPEKHRQENPEFETEKELIHFKNKAELYNILRDRLKDYDNYINLKNETKIKKDEFERLSKAQKGSNESSKD